jgi:hypothetical protein
VLSDCDGLTVHEIACSVYGERPALRRGWHRRAPEGRLSATRRALRQLIRKKRVVVAAIQRRRKIFAVANRTPLSFELGAPLHV